MPDERKHEEQFHENHDAKVIFDVTILKDNKMQLREEHCLKSDRIRSYSRLYFPTFRLNTERYSNFY